MGYRVEFNNTNEVRMGSPYLVVEDFKLVGDYVPSINMRDSLQDKYLILDDQNIIFLVAWDVSPDNNPGFRVLKIDGTSKKMSSSERVPGCCKTLSISAGTLNVEVFKGLKGLDIKNPIIEHLEISDFPITEEEYKSLMVQD